MRIHHDTSIDGSEENGGALPERKVYSYMNMRAKVSSSAGPVTMPHTGRAMLMTAIPVGQPGSVLQRESRVAFRLIAQLTCRSDTMSVSRRTLNRRWPVSACIFVRDGRESGNTRTPLALVHLTLNHLDPGLPWRPIAEHQR
jgi:hypothetical protein